MENTKVKNHDNYVEFLEETVAVQSRMINLLIQRLKEVRKTDETPWRHS